MIGEVENCDYQIDSFCRVVGLFKSIFVTYSGDPFKWARFLVYSC